MFLALAPARANATAIDAGAFFLFIMPFVVEPVFPDLRLEFEPASTHLVLAWPLHLWTGAFPRWERRSLEGPPVSVFVSPFVEPQLALGGATRFRALGGLRTGVALGRGLPTFFLDGAGRWTTSGWGGSAGLGIGWMYLREKALHVSFELVARRTWAPEGTSHDLSLGLTLPLSVFARALSPKEPQ